MAQTGSKQFTFHYPQWRVLSLGEIGWNRTLPYAKSGLRITISSARLVMVGLVP